MKQWIKITLILLALLPVPTLAADTTKRPLTVAMTAAFVSEQGLSVYEDITRYLAKKTGEKADFITGLSYSTVNAMIDKGAAQVAFVCGYPYILSNENVSKPVTKLLAAPVPLGPLYKGQPKYYSYMIVHKDSPFKSFADLKNSVYVYNDSISNSGYNMPRARMIELGETHGFFKKILHSGSHEESIRMVATKEAQASAVDSLVLDYSLSVGDPFAQQVKIIETLGPAGIPPVVYSTSMSSASIAKVKNALLHMHEDTEGHRILAKANLAKFVEVDDSNYDDIRHMHKMAQDAGYMVIK